MYSIHILHTYRFSNNNFIVYVDLQKLNKSWQWYIAYWTEGPKTLRRDVRENYRFKFGRGAIAPAYYLLFSLSLFHSLLFFPPSPSLSFSHSHSPSLFHSLSLSSYLSIFLLRSHPLSLSFSRARARARARIQIHLASAIHTYTFTLWPSFSSFAKTYTTCIK